MTSPLAAATRMMRTARIALSLCAIPLGLGFADPLHAQQVDSAFPAQPPADVAYLRIVNASSLTTPFALLTSGRAMLDALAPGDVTRYSVLEPHQKVELSVDGQPMDVALDAAAHAVITLALIHDTTGWHTLRLDSDIESASATPPTLHFFNLLPACADGSLAVAHGAAMFDNVAGGQARTRAVNPANATLIGACGSAHTAALTLPLATSGSYSVFLLGDAKRPMLFGAQDIIVWPPGDL